MCKFLCRINCALFGGLFWFFTTCKEFGSTRNSSKGMCLLVKYNYESSLTSPGEYCSLSKLAKVAHMKRVQLELSKRKQHYVWFLLLLRFFPLPRIFFSALFFSDWLISLRYRIEVWWCLSRQYNRCNFRILMQQLFSWSTESWQLLTGQAPVSCCFIGPYLLTRASTSWT